MKRSLPLLLLLLTITASGMAQAITGVWRGKVSRGLKQYNLELKLIRDGDSLTGTSYYYHSANNYSRFTVKGYFDVSGDIVWWDEERIESKGGKLIQPNSEPFRFATDFNCPGNDVMMLDGTAQKGDDEKPHEVHLTKVGRPNFQDEWDEVIEDFPYYAGVPGLIEEVSRKQRAESREQGPEGREQGPEGREQKAGSSEQGPKPVASGPFTARTEKPSVSVPVKQPEKNTSAVSSVPAPPSEKTSPSTASVPSTPAKSTGLPPATVKAAAPVSIEDKFSLRRKTLVTSIPIEGDSISLNFYDHAEIDGDSISLFLNGKILYTHILLKAQPFQFSIPTAELAEENELVMVAENLGSIPPNTSLMIVYVNGVRHEVRLESTLQTSAMIRFTRKSPSISGTPLR